MQWNARHSPTKQYSDACWNIDRNLSQISTSLYYAVIVYSIPPLLKTYVWVTMVTNDNQ